MSSNKFKGHNRVVAWALVLVLLFIGIVVCMMPSYEVVYAQEATPVPAPAFVPLPIADSITNPYQRQIDPSPLVVGEDASAEMRLLGFDRDGCYGIPGKPVDMMLVYDISTSAGAGAGSNWETTTQFSQSLLDHLSRPIYPSAVGSPAASGIGLISSQVGPLGSEPYLIQPLSQNYGLLRQQVSSITPSGDTNLTAGLKLAAEELARVETPDRAQAVVLMLHDNVIDMGGMETAVAQLQSQNIPVYVVVNSLNILQESRLTQAEVGQLTDNDKIFIDPTPEELYGLFVQATEGNEDAVAASVQIYEEWTPPGATQIFGVTGPNGQIQGERVVWDIGFMDGGDSESLTYDFRLAADGAASVSGVVWLDCNGYPHSTFADVPVDGVTDAPMPLEDFDPVLPGETPEADNAAPSSTGDDSTLDLPDVDMLDIDGSGLLIFGLPWWIWLLILIPIILLLLWLLLHWLKGRNKPISIPGYEPKLRKERPTVTSDKSGIKLPNGEDVAHGWVQYPGNADVQYQVSNDGTSLIIQAIDSQKKPIVTATTQLHTLEEQDPRTGRMVVTIQAELNHWRIDNAPWYNNRMRETILAAAENLVHQKGAAEMVIPMDTLEDGSSLLSAQGYELQDGIWIKEV